MSTPRESSQETPLSHLPNQPQERALPSDRLHLPTVPTEGLWGCELGRHLERVREHIYSAESTLFEWKEMSSFQGSRAPAPAIFLPELLADLLARSPPTSAWKPPALLRSEGRVLRKGLELAFCGYNRLIWWLLWAKFPFLLGRPHPISSLRPSS